MKRLFLLTLFLLCGINGYAQQRFIFDIDCGGISFLEVSLTAQLNDCYKVVVENDTGKCPRSYGIFPSSVPFYLSYENKCVSDVYKFAIEYEDYAETVTEYYKVLNKEIYVYIWPDTVPSGHEKYVTVKYGYPPKPEPIRDRRDDF